METINSEKRHFPLYLKERMATYLVTCVFLGILNIVVTPHEWWIFWVALGWGMNLIKPDSFLVLYKRGGGKKMMRMVCWLEGNLILKH